jgi:hypothetical protein
MRRLTSPARNPPDEDAGYSSTLLVDYAIRALPGYETHSADPSVTVEYREIENSGYMMRV